MTISEKRKNAVVTIAKRRWDNPTDEQLGEVRSLMNSLYRLRGLAARNLEYCNNVSVCNTAWVRKSEERQEKWYKRVREKFVDYGILCLYVGSYPDLYERGTNNSVIDLCLTYDY